MKFETRGFRFFCFPPAFKQLENHSLFMKNNESRIFTDSIAAIPRAEFFRKIIKSDFQAR